VQPIHQPVDGRSTGIASSPETQSGVKGHQSRTLSQNRVMAAKIRSRSSTSHS
jgi:hypothetical protein